MHDLLVNTIGKDMHDFCVELLIMHDAYEED